MGLLVVLAATVSPVAAAAIRNLGHEQGFVRGVLDVALVDDAGRPVDGPGLELAGLAPGSQTAGTVVTVSNTGDLPAEYRLSAADLASAGEGSLDEVLVVTVTDRDSGALVYRGRLSGLDVHGPAPLDPGRSRSFVVRVGWPDAPADDDPFQGETLSFALRLDAEASN
jgi:hypothetical protein